MREVAKWVVLDVVWVDCRLYSFFTLRTLVSYINNGMRDSALILNTRDLSDIHIVTSDDVTLRGRDAVVRKLSVIHTNDPPNLI